MNQISFRMLILIICSASLMIAEKAWSEGRSCSSVLVRARALPPGRDLPINLRLRYLEDTAGSSIEEIEASNEGLLKSFENYVPEDDASGATYVPEGILHSVLVKTADHKVVGLDAIAKYARPEVDIGFCFGRATFIHELLRRLNVANSIIRKIWVVGPAEPNEENPNLWEFHVATVAYSDKRGWLVIDPKDRRLLTMEEWMAKWKGLDKGGKSKFYVTDPEKFAFTTGAYDPVQMGLRLSRADDWYHHYFVDMYDSLRFRAPYGIKQVPVSFQASTIGQNRKPGIKPRSGLIDFLLF